MSGIVGIVVAVVVGVVVAGGAAFGLVSSQTAAPPVADAPYVVYGENAP